MPRTLRGVDQAVAHAERTCTFVTVAMRVLQRVHREWNERARAFLAEAEAEAGASRRIRM